MTVKTLALEHAGAITPADDIRECRRVWSDVRARFGLGPDNGSALLTLPTAQPKVGLNSRPTASLTLTAGRADGLCVNDGACRATCVVAESWRASTSTVSASRAARTELLTEHGSVFLALLLDRLSWAHDRHGIVDIRPNANSDVAWEIIAPAMFDLLSSWNGRAYDYTKRLDRVGMLTGNYRTTFSATGATREATVRRLVDRGDTVTAVFSSLAPMPARWHGIPVVNGDTTDDRFSDPSGVIVGLKAKGKLKGLSSHPMIVTV